VKQIIKSKKTWRWLGVISAFLFLDLMIIGPTLKVNTQGKVERINQLIDRYTPIYTGSKGRSLYSLRSGYFYKLELEDDISISPHPRDVSEGKCGT
jgi:hypothetical protein